MAEMSTPVLNVLTEHSTVTKTTEILEPFYMDENFGIPCHVDPIHMLFNEKRLQNIGQSAIDMLVAEIKGNMSKTNLAFRNAISGLSDSQICQLVKSRYIQSPCEIKAYFNQISEDVVGFKKRVADILKQSETIKQTEKEVNLEVNQPQTVA